MNCPNCRTTNPDNARFCLHCGSSLESVRPVVGERRLVTVLFADVVGSTSMAEHLDPEQVTEIMNGAFAFMNDAVGQYDGTIARLMGDAIMAVFGAPIAHENDPERAVRAAIEIREAANAYSQRVKSEVDHEFNVRVGVNTGLVVVATVGDQLRSEHTAMGDTVNVAARLQQVADPGTVLISAETLRLAGHAFTVEARGAVRLKGKTEPVEAFEVISPSPIPGQARGLAGIKSPLVGRSSELELLTEKLEDAAHGQGSILSVTGEAGLGKSRLIAELRDHAEGADETTISWLETRSQSYGQVIPYAPWRGLIRQAIGASATDPPQTVRVKIREHLESLEHESSHAPLLETILGVESEESQNFISELDGGELLSHLTSAVVALVSGTLQSQPHVIVFDDLHWSDPGSLRLISEIAELVYEQPLLIILVLRPEKDAPSSAFIEEMATNYQDRYAHIPLEPLSGTDSGELLGNLLYIEDLPGRVRDLILTKADGNPFFLEEVIRTLIDCGYIIRHNGHWRATSDIVSVQVPDTLVGVLGARIDRLPDETKQVAQIAATIGRIFSYALLKAVCASAPEPERIEDPLPHLVMLAEEEIVRERARHPQLEYIFKHVLTQEAAYNLLLVRTRRTYHMRVGLVLEAEYADRLDEMSATLAHHFWNAEDWSRVLDYSLRAGTRAETKYFALREAHEHFDRAFQALERMGPENGDRYPEVVLASANTALKCLPREELLNRLHRAEVITRRNGDKVSLSRVLHLIAHIHALSGFMSRAIPALVENYDLADEIGDQRLSLYPSWAMAFEMLNVNPRSAAEKLLEVAERARQYKNRHLEVHGTASAAIGHARLGEFEKARSLLEEARIASEQTDEPVTIAGFHLLESFAYLDMGEYELSLEHGRIGIDQALAANALECVAAGYCAIGMGELQNRRAERALNTFQESFQLLNQFRGDVQVVNQLDAGMAIARYATGETQDLNEIQAALAASDALEDKYTVAQLSRTLAEAYLDRDDLEQADKHLSTALDYYRTHQMRPQLVQTLEIHARLLEAQGSTAEAAEARAEAGRLAAELGEPWLAPTTGAFASLEPSSDLDD